MLLKHPVIQVQVELFLAVLQGDFQGVYRLVLRCKHGWKAFQPIFPMVGLIAVKKQQAVPDARPQIRMHTANPVIPAAPHWKFLRQKIKGIGPVLPCLIDIPGKSPVLHGNQIGIIRFVRFLSIISVQEDAFAVSLHLVGTVFCLEGKYIVFDNDCHRLTAFLYI